jgi:hypothetical protein
VYFNREVGTQIEFIADSILTGHFVLFDPFEPVGGKASRRGRCFRTTGDYFTFVEVRVGVFAVIATVWNVLSV